MGNSVSSTLRVVRNSSGKAAKNWAGEMAIRPNESCGSMIERGTSIVAVAGTSPTGPESWYGERARSTLPNGKRMRGPAVAKAVVASLGAGWVRSVARPVALRSFDGGLTLNGIRAAGGGARGEGKGVGMGGPLEAGTLSVAGTPTPFGEKSLVVSGGQGCVGSSPIGADAGALALDSLGSPGIGKPTARIGAGESETTSAVAVGNGSDAVGGDGKRMRFGVEEGAEAFSAGA